jgi:hypothetical protein
MMEFLQKASFACLVMGRDGQIDLPFPASCGEAHSGPCHLEPSVSLDIISAGRGSFVVVDGLTTYAPWLASMKRHPCNQGGRPGTKNNPGGALSMTMPEFRFLLNQKCTELQAMTPEEEQAVFGHA